MYKIKGKKTEPDFSNPRIFCFLGLWVGLLWGLSMISIPLMGQEPEHRQIVETVEVGNIEVPVRVFDGDQPVDGLTREDFQLVVDNTIHPINGFYLQRKRLEEKTVQGDTLQHKPRFFLLIFNLTHYQDDLAKHLDVLFDRIIHPSDQLMAITNHYFYPQWQVENPLEVKAKIQSLLKQEVNKMRFELLRMENELKSVTSMTLSRLNDEKESESKAKEIFEEFFLSYQFVIEDIKKEYFKLPTSQYLKVAEYIKAQSMDKWVLNFYQVGRLPVLDSFGELTQKINEIIEDINHPLSKNVKEQYYKYLLSFQEQEDLFFKDIAKVFIDSGATFYTQLINPLPSYFSNNYRYESTNSDSEIILKELSHLTGGAVVNTNRIENFIKEITIKEDIVYMLTFAPPKKDKTPILKITVKKPGLRVVYDDQKRQRAFLDEVEKISQVRKNIEIGSLHFAKGELIVTLKNLELVDYDGERYGAVKARIFIFDKRSQRKIAAFAKIYRGIGENGVFAAPLPPIPRGQYNLVIEVKDLFSLKDVYAGDSVAINQ